MNCARNHLSPHCLWTAGFPQQIVRPRLIQTRPSCLSCEALPNAWGGAQLKERSLRMQIAPAAVGSVDRVCAALAANDGPHGGIVAIWLRR